MAAKRHPSSTRYVLHLRVDPPNQRPPDSNLSRHPTNTPLPLTTHATACLSTYNFAYVPSGRVSQLSLFQAKCPYICTRSREERCNSGLFNAYKRTLASLLEPAKSRSWKLATTLNGRPYDNALTILPADTCQGALIIVYPHGSRLFSVSTVCRLTRGHHWSVPHPERAHAWPDSVQIGSHQLWEVLASYSDDGLKK